MRFKVKKGDNVFIITGKEKGKKGVITEVLVDKKRVRIEGLNLATCFNKKAKTGISKKAMSVHISNVMHVDPETQLRTKVAIKYNENGKEIISKKSNSLIRRV